MAKILADLALRISTDSAELSKGLEQVKSKLGGLKDKFGEIGEHTEKVMGAIGSAIGGVVGSVSEFVGAIATATGPIGVLVAVIGSIGMAWKEAKEGIEEYLKSADKIKYGAGAFTQESKDARKETASRARSGIISGQMLIQKADIDQERLASLGTLTEEQNNLLNEQRNIGKDMIRDNQILLQQAEGKEGRLEIFGSKQLDWTQKYNELLLNQEELDEKKISNDTKLKELQAKLFDLRGKIVQEKDPEEKAKIQKDYEEVVNAILENRMEIINETRSVTGDLLKMTGKDHEFKILNLNLDNQEMDAKKENERLSFKAIMLELKIETARGKQVKSAEELLALQKEINNHVEAGYKLDLLKGTGVTSDLDKALTQGFDAKLKAIMAKRGLKVTDDNLTNKEIEAINRETTAYENQMSVLQGLTNVFENLFSSVDQGFKGIAKAFGNMLAYMAQQMLAKAAVFAIMKVLFPESGLFEVGGALFGGFLKNILPHFASGTSFAPGGLSLVGERGPELVSIPRGSQVYSNSQSNTIMANNLHITVDGKISGRDLALVLRRAEQSN